MRQSNRSTATVVVLKVEHVNELNSSHQDSMLLATLLKRQVEVVLIGHCVALVDASKVFLLELRYLSFALWSWKSLEVHILARIAAATILLSIADVSIAHVSSEGPESVLLISLISFVAHNLEGACVTRTAWHLY